MTSHEKVLACVDVRGVELSVPPGHQHLRARLLLSDGTVLVLQEATVAGLVRAYVTVKTHPTRNSVILKGAALNDGDGKPGYAAGQLLEDD